ncbi:uncharacterized protein DUF1738 [Pontibacter ummariensis]|uniref:N-terminal domain-containing protein n=1 Tax=Pontibacter ummariensis TaxID=1610492 RepID=A0A239DPB9_9BACT|nr:ArdC family protein [Pontibacter ummariensis]PRY13812.1 uncharacterized protein DUF1738 [Pontibacter ummariensis]SNS34495.1 protein of unknown function [Pontibacter ummariensis]
MNAFEKFNQLAEQVTNEIITQLEQGKVPWQKPWTSYGLPKNYLSGRHYEGFNAFYLHYITEERCFTTPYFLTFKQAKELGGHVKKGEKGSPILYWKIREEKESEFLFSIVSVYYQSLKLHRPSPYQAKFYSQHNESTYCFAHSCTHTEALGYLQIR